MAKTKKIEHEIETFGHIHKFANLGLARFCAFVARIFLKVFISLCGSVFGFNSGNTVHSARKGVCSCYTTIKHHESCV